MSRGEGQGDVARVSSYDDWERTFLEYFEQKSIAESIIILNEMKSSHRPSPNAKIKERAIDLIVQRIKNPRHMLKVCIDLIDSQTPTGREMASQLLPTIHTDFPIDVSSMLKDLCNDNNWEVREWAASGCGQILSQNFEGFYPTLKMWTQDDSAKVRRAVAISAKMASRARKPEWCSPLLSLMDDLIRDSDPYVRKNMGPFAIGDGTLRYYPEETIAHISQWATMPDIFARWNAAMSFSAAEGAKYPEIAEGILTRLSVDPISVVRRAVDSAVRQLQKRLPDFRLGVSFNETK